MRMLGRYEIVDELGRGGAAIVYLARDTATDRAVALKVLAPHLPRQGDVVARFQREIKLAVQLEHPHIVPIFDVGLEDDQPYIVLRLLSGGSLADRLQYGPLSLATALGILKQVASALDAAHRLKIIHRDVKPSNILFDQAGTAYLADFGIAKAIDVVTTPMNSWAVGTPAFMSPEQLRGQPIDARTDEYALGLVAFAMLTAQLPYTGTAAHIITQQLVEPLPNVSLINPQLPASVQTVLEHATAKDPALRYASAGEFVAALEGVLQNWLALGGTTPQLEPADLAPARALAAAEPAAGAPAPEAVGELAPPAPYAHLSLNRDLEPLRAPAAADRAVAAGVVAPPPASGRRPWPGRRWPWLVAVLGIALAIVLISGWQLGAFNGLAGITPGTIDRGATLAAGQAGTQSAAITRTATSPATSLPFMVTLAPDAIGLAIITVPPGTAGAALRTNPTGDTILILPNRTIVQVFAGRQQAPDGSAWVPVRAPSGEAGWVAEALLTYLNQSTAILTPAAGAATPGPATTGGATTPPPAAAGATNGPPAATGQPAATFSLTPAPAATAPPGPASTSPVATPKPGATPTLQPPISTGPLPTHTTPPATHTTAPGNTPGPTNTTVVVSTNTPAPPSNTPAPPTSTPAPTNTPVPSNTPLLGILPTQLCLLPPLC